MNGSRCCYQTPDGVRERMMASWFNNIQASCDSDSDTDDFTTSEDSTEEEVFVEVVNCLTRQRRPCCRCGCANQEAAWEVVPPRPTRKWGENFNVLRDQWSLVTMSHSLRTFQARGQLDRGAALPGSSCSCGRPSTAQMVSVASTVVSCCSATVGYPPTDTCAGVDGCPTSQWRRTEEGKWTIPQRESCYACCGGNMSPYRPVVPECRASFSCAPPEPQCTCQPTPCSEPCIIQLPCPPRCYCCPRRRGKNRRTINIQLVCPPCSEPDTTGVSGFPQDMSSFVPYEERSNVTFQPGSNAQIDLPSAGNYITDGSMIDKASIDPYGPSARGSYYDSGVAGTEGYPGDVGYGSVGPGQSMSRRSMSGSKSFKEVEGTSIARPSVGRTLLSDVESVSGENTSSTLTSTSTSTVEQVDAADVTSAASDLNNSHESNKSNESIDAGPGLSDGDVRSAGNKTASVAEQPSVTTNVSTSTTSTGSSDQGNISGPTISLGNNGDEKSSTKRELSGTVTQEEASAQPSNDISSQNDTGDSQNSLVEDERPRSDTRVDQGSNDNVIDDTNKSVGLIDAESRGSYSNASRRSRLDETGSRDLSGSHRSNKSIVEDRQSIPVQDLDRSLRSKESIRSINVDDDVISRSSRHSSKVQHESNAGDFEYSTGGIPINRDASSSASTSSKISTTASSDKYVESDAIPSGEGSQVDRSSSNSASYVRSVQSHPSVESHRRSSDHIAEPSSTLGDTSTARSFRREPSTGDYESPTGDPLSKTASRWSVSEDMTNSRNIGDGSFTASSDVTSSSESESTGPGDVEESESTDEESLTTRTGSSDHSLRSSPSDRSSASRSRSYSPSSYRSSDRSTEASDDYGSESASAPEESVGSTREYVVESYRGPSYVSGDHTVNYDVYDEEGTTLQEQELFSEEISGRRDSDVSEFRHNDTTLLRVCAACLVVLTVAVCVAYAIYKKLFNCHNWFPDKCTRKEYCFFFKGSEPANNGWSNFCPLWRR